LLQELSIKNFAIIDELSLTLDRGLTVLSGETGAGKSIIIDAVHLLTGGRGSSEFVRHGEKKAELEGLFLLDHPDHPCYQKASEFGIEIEEGMIIFRREISASGKSVCRINGKLVPISTLREVGSSLIDIHGQHEHQELMDEHFHLSLLDQFGSSSITIALESYREIYDTYILIKKRLQELSQNEQQMVHRLDLIQFQVNEIQEANLLLNEDAELEVEKRKLLNFERLSESLQQSYQSLSGDQQGLDWIAFSMGHLETAAELDSDFSAPLEAVSNCYYVLEEAVQTIRAKMDLLEFEPERLNTVEERLNEINHLKRKYGNSIDQILEYFAKIEEEIETITNRETHLDQLQKKLESLELDIALESKQLTDVRKKWAKKLTKDILTELKELYMDKTIFEVRFQQEYANRIYRPNGVDQVEFYISTNPGEPLKPLSKVASGGEMSRIMLALKTIFSRHQGITSIIFDEVDTGVSGRVAQAIGEKIYAVSISSQVMCISHLPQVAAMADTHLYISKKTSKGRTKTAVNVLENQERINEIGRMIAGAEITDLTKKHAKELLDLAKSNKKT
jgi:DNA repair protein RecN (Recombination protein N)